MSIRVMLAEDHTIMRQGLRALLDQTGDIRVVAEAATGNEALALIPRCRPEVIVMDLNMPDVGGIEATRRICAEDAEARVLVLSMVLDRGCVAEALKAGAKGYLVKDCAAEELVTAIQTLAAGEAYLCARVAEIVIRDYARNLPAAVPVAPRELSPREREVLRLIADGLSTKEIAFRLDLSIKTIEVQRSRIMKKLELYSVAELTKYAVRQGLSSIG